MFWATPRISAALPDVEEILAGAQKDTLAEGVEPQSEVYQPLYAAATSPLWKRGNGLFQAEALNAVHGTLLCPMALSPAPAYNTLCRWASLSCPPSTHSSSSIWNPAHRVSQNNWRVAIRALFTIHSAPWAMPKCVLPPNIRPINPARRLAGQVFTVSGRPGRYDDHETLLQWTRLLSKAPADSVVICQPNDNTMALMGELSSETLKARGIRGYIVDGGCRDTEFIHRIGFPVFCKFYTPLDIVGRWIADSLGGPIQIGSVTIHSGDYVTADVDGIVVIPRHLAEQVAEEAERVVRTESLVRKAILSGADPEEAYLKYGKF